MNKLFLIRVELHGAVERDYQVLHIAMAKYGFNRNVTGMNGVNFELPSAEYLGWSKLNITAVKNLAKTAANSTGKTSWILVVETTDFSNLAWELRVVK